MEKTNDAYRCAVVMFGIPGSGKSTLAQRLQKTRDNIAIVSRDKIRADLGLCLPGEKCVGNKEQEELVSKMEYEFIRNAYNTGKDIIIDDTNLKSKYRRPLIDFLKELGYSIVVYNIITPFEECVERRRDEIPLDVMSRMFDTKEVPREDECDYIFLYDGRKCEENS